jgi:hypothetical protein
MTWAAEQLGGFEGKSVLELGPLEAGHTYMLERGGAASITAVEGNRRAFLKCLIIKELLGLRRAQFLCGDFVEYLRRERTRFDVCIASGVLYHMVNPAELLALLARSSDRAYIWTHYYDKESIAAKPALIAKLPSSHVAEYEGFRHTLYRYEYQTALEWAGFCGGSAPFSHWLSRADIFACLRHFGLTDIRVAFDEPDHVNGPSVALVALRP